MKEKEIYSGFDMKKQKEYEKQLIDRYGDKVKPHFVECETNVKKWTKDDWDRSGQEFDRICKDLANLLKKGFSGDSKEVQAVVRQHHHWLKKFWTPTRESYAGHGKLIVESDLRKAYEAYHPKLPEFLDEAIQVFAKKELA